MKLYLKSEELCTKQFVIYMVTNEMRGVVKTIVIILIDLNLPPKHRLRFIRST
jgi:hypothetical protein